MKHLSSAEFVDFIEGTLSEARASHVARCERCRRQAKEFHTTLAKARGVETPEPSPLFWEYLSARIRAAVVAEPPPRGLNARIWRPAVGLVAAAAVVVLVVLTMWPRAREPRVEQVSTAPEGSGRTAKLEPLTGFEDEPVDETWQMVVAMSSDLQWDEAEEAGFGVRHGTADRLLSTLTAAERLELTQILRTELSRGKSM